jgi:hypothetical protein
MKSVHVAPVSVNNPVTRRRPGQPTKKTPERLQEINRALVQALLTGSPLPTDQELAEKLEISARTVRDMRLNLLGLERRELAHWRRSLPTTHAEQDERELICSTPFAGLWLLIPLILASGLAEAAGQLRILKRTSVQGVQVVLTLMAWAALGLERLWHVNDFRHWADLGLALFTGSLCLWSDTTLWRWVHGMTPLSAAGFYQATAQREIAQPDGRARYSLDDHVVPSFTQRRPSPLGKSRIPSRGRSYPALRLFAAFDLDLGRFVALQVRQARQALSQVLLEALAELRHLRNLAQTPDPEQVRLIFDRGGYKGSLFQALMEEAQVSFVAMARATQANVRQWENLPEANFHPYQPPGVDNPNLKIGLAETHIYDCQVPLPSVVIRDDTPDTKQRWRVLFYKNLPNQPAEPAALDAEYRQRQQHEMGFRQYVHALTGHALPKAYQMIRLPNAQGQRRHTVATDETSQSQQDVHLVAWIKFLTFNLIQDFGQALGKKTAKLQTATLMRRYLHRPGKLYLQADKLIVQLDPFCGHEDLETFIQDLNATGWHIPWLNGLILQVEVARKPWGLMDNPKVLRHRILANSSLANLL